MIIQSDNVNMAASRRYSRSQANYSRLSAWNASGQKTFSLEDSNYSRIEAYTESQNRKTEKANRAGTSKASEQTDTENATTETGLSQNCKMNDLIGQMQSSSNIRRSTVQERLDALTQIRQKTLSYLLYILFGRGIPGTDGASTGESLSFSDALSQTGSDGTASTSQYGAGSEYYSYFYYSEQETTCFDAQGTAITADGREIPFQISLEMSRSFTEMAEHQIDFGKPRLCDPLVINLNNNVASVSDQKFLFDIDADGTKDSISMLESGSGYLALDKNGDGVINDGSELFGTESGNGFRDLAAFDQDQNGWIDEADEIFRKLRIWTKDENGNDMLLSLSDAGVGAIYLGYENTDFALNSMQDNTTNAMVRRTGIFLYENGGSGSVQQLDLAT